MNPAVLARCERSASAQRCQIWIAISLTNRGDRWIFAASKLLIELKPHHENRSPAQFHRHACLHDAALFLGGDGRLLLLTSS
jgi:hypothetical protein